MESKDYISKIKELVSRLENQLKILEESDDKILKEDTLLSLKTTYALLDLVNYKLTIIQKPTDKKLDNICSNNPSSGFSFGGSTNPSSGFSFGASNNNTSFSFGASNNPTGFSFGASNNPTGFSFDASNNSTGFSFGSSNNSPGFSFGASNNLNRGFNFGGFHFDAIAPGDSLTLHRSSSLPKDIEMRNDNMYKLCMITTHKYGCRLWMLDTKYYHGYYSRKDNNFWGMNGFTSKQFEKIKDKLNSEENVELIFQNDEILIYFSNDDKSITSDIKDELICEFNKRYNDSE